MASQFKDRAAKAILAEMPFVLLPGMPERALVFYVLPNGHLCLEAIHESGTQNSILDFSSSGEQL